MNLFIRTAMAAIVSVASLTAGDLTLTFQSTHKGPMGSGGDGIQTHYYATNFQKTVDQGTRIDTLVDYVKGKGANVILRGLRAVSDFEYEFQMALINRRLNRDVETVFLMTGYQWFYTSSNLIKEAASLGGSVQGLVPDLVNERLQQLFGKAKE